MARLDRTGSILAITAALMPAVVAGCKGNRKDAGTGTGTRTGTGAAAPAPDAAAAAV